MRASENEVRLLMQVVVSLTLLGVGLWIMVSSFDESLKKFAAGWIGAVVGYWLK